MKKYKNLFYVVLDFEATCEDGKLIFPQEIIQFPAVLVDGCTFAVLDTFNVFVKPKHNPTLTPFCCDLTGIQQEQVDAGVSFMEALMLFYKWLENHNLLKRSFTFVTWGNWDLMCMFPAQCELVKLQVPRRFTSWLNIKYAVNSLGSIHPSVSCKDIVTKYFHLPWIGTEHNGLHDSLNVSQLLPIVLGSMYNPPSLTYLNVYGRKKWEAIQQNWHMKGKKQ